MDENQNKAFGINKTTSKLFPIRVMQQPFDQKLSFLNKLYQKCDRGRVKRNWLEGLSIKPGFYSLCFFQLVYWLEQRKIPFLASLLASFWWLFTNLDIYPEHSIGKQDGECRSIFGNFIVTPIVNIPDRAKPEIMQHLQALAIPCWRTRDGNIWVEVRDVNVAVLVYNAIEQSTAKHQELVELLQHCWDVK